MQNLNPMDISEYEKYIEESLQEFKRQLLKAGDKSEQEAEENTRKQIIDILPDGIKTKGHYFFNIVDGKTNEKIGNLWLAVKNGDDGLPTVFIYDILIDADFRGKGYGKITLGRVEEFAKEQKASKIFLHVFAHNQIAFELYKKIGYRVVREFKDKKEERILSYRMVKEIK